MRSIFILLTTGLLGTNAVAATLECSVTGSWYHEAYFKTETKSTSDFIPVEGTFGIKRANLQIENLVDETTVHVNALEPSNQIEVVITDRVLGTRAAGTFKNTAHLVSEFPDRVTEDLNQNQMGVDCELK